MGSELISQRSFFTTAAVIEADGTMVETGAECKQGIDISYKGIWGYHPLVVTLANTGEVLRLKNRSGNRPSHEGRGRTTGSVDCVVLQGGLPARSSFGGDTDFSQTKHLDGWHGAGVTFVFGYDCTNALGVLADDLPETAWKPLSRPPRYEVKTSPRARSPNRSSSRSSRNAASRTFAW